MSAETPRRIGAILSADGDEVKLLGFGVYLGRRLCPVGPFGFSLEEYRAHSLKLGMGEPEPFRNPCIRLDSGRYVWGFQCWWGDEAQCRESFGSRLVEVVEIESLEPLEEPDSGTA